MRDDLASVHKQSTPEFAKLILWILLDRLETHPRYLPFKWHSSGDRSNCIILKALRNSHEKSETLAGRVSQQSPINHQKRAPRMNENISSSAATADELSWSSTDRDDLSEDDVEAPRPPTQELRDDIKSFCAINCCTSADCTARQICKGVVRHCFSQKPNPPISSFLFLLHCKTNQV